MATSFEELIIWQKARGQVSSCFDLLEVEELRPLWSVKNQLVNAAISVMNNIAEGFERGGNREFKNFLAVAKASNGEVRSMLYVFLDRGWIDEKQMERHTSQNRQIAAGIQRMIVHIQGSDFDGPNRREVRDGLGDYETELELPDEYFAVLSSGSSKL